jgi:hypothetical protein
MALISASLSIQTHRQKPFNVWQYRIKASNLILHGQKKQRYANASF